MSMKILTYLVLALLITATCFASRADKSNEDAETSRDPRQRVLQPRAGKPRDRRTLILLMPEEENLGTFEGKDTSPSSTKTKRCKTPTRRVRLSVPTSDRLNSPRIRQTDEYRPERQHNDRKEHALPRAPSVRIIPLRDPKAMLRSGLMAGGSSPEGIGNRRENVGLLKVLEDNLKPRQGEISTTNKRRQRAKPSLTDDSRYVCYCREENEDDANSPKGLSQNPLLQQPLQRKNKCGRKQPRAQVIASAPPGKSSLPEIPGNRFIPQGFPVLYPNVPQIPRYPINIGEQVGASLPVGDGIAGLPYLPVVYKMQPKLTLPASTLTGDTPVKLNIPAPTDNDFFIGQARSNKIRPKFPCVPVTEGSKYETTSLPEASDSEDSIIGVPQSGEDEMENTESHSTESADDSRIGTSGNQWPSSMEQANFEECIKIYGRKVCVISGTPAIRPTQRTTSFEDSYGYHAKSTSIEDYDNESDSPVSKPNPESHEYGTNDSGAENNNTDDTLAAKHDEPEDNFRHHQPDLTLGKGTNPEGTLDYSDIHEVTATYFTSKAYENETNVADFAPSSFDHLYTTSSGSEDVGEQEDTVGATPPGPNSNENVESQFNTEEIITIQSESEVLQTTEMSEVSKEENPELRADELGQGARNNIPEQGRANNSDEIYDDSSRDATVGVQNTENENIPAPSDSPERDFSSDRKCPENPKVGQSMDDDVLVERTTHLSSGEETIESRDEGTLENTPSDTIGNESEDPVTETSSPTNDEIILGNSENTENGGSDGDLTKSNEENVDTTEAIIAATNTYEENTDSLTGVAPSTGNTGEDESWKAVLPFCDNTLLQNSIKTVINNFANKNAEDTKEGDGETVGASHNLLAEVLEVPNLKNVLFVPQIETMIIEKVKDLVSEVSGLPRKDFSNDWTTNIIKSNLNHMMSGTKSKSGNKLPSMTVEEREFKDGQWQTHFATIAPVSGNEQKALSEFDQVKHNMRNLLDDPAVGMQAAKHPIVQNMIIESIRSHHRIDETKLRGVLDHLVGKMKDTKEKDEEDAVENKLINTDSTIQPANAETYYDDDAPDIITDTDKTEDAMTDNPDDPELGSSHKDTPETIPVEDGKSQGETVSTTTGFYEKKILETTVSSSRNDVFPTTDASTYTLSKEDPSKFPKVSCTTDDTTPETGTNLEGSNKDADDITNPIESNDESALGSPHTVFNNEPQLNSKIPDDEKVREDEQLGSDNVTSTVDTGIIDDNDNLEQVVGDSPTKFYSPNDRILNYIKNHQTGAAKVGGDPQDVPEINSNEQTSISVISHTSQADYAEVKEQTTVSNYGEQPETGTSRDSDLSDSPNVGVTQSVVISDTESPNPGVTESTASPTLEDNFDDQTQDTGLVGKPLTNSRDSEAGSIGSGNQFRTGSRNNHQTTKPQYLKTHEVTTTDIQKVTKTTRYFLPNGKAVNDSPYENESPIEEESDESGLVGAAAPEDSDASEDYTYFGKIVPNKANYPSDVKGLQQSDLFFVGDGVRLPLEIRKQSDGSYALTISRKVCEHMLRKECPCCVPRQGNVVRSIRRNGPKENQKYSLYEANRDLFRTVRPARKSQGRQIIRPIIPNDRVKRESVNDSPTISMPVEVFAKKYNLSLDLEEIEAFGAWYKRGDTNRYASDNKNDYSSRNGSPSHDSSRSKKSGRFSSIERSDEIDNKDLYVVIDGKPTRIRHLDWDTIDSREFSHRKDPIVDRIKYSREDQRAPVRYRYHRNVDGSSDRRTEVAKSVLNWFRDLFLNAAPNDASRRR